MDWSGRQWCLDWCVFLLVLNADFQRRRQCVNFWTRSEETDEGVRLVTWQVQVVLTEPRSTAVFIFCFSARLFQLHTNQEWTSTRLWSLRAWVWAELWLAVCWWRTMGAGGLGHVSANDFIHCERKTRKKHLLESLSVHFYDCLLPSGPNVATFGCNLHLCGKCRAEYVGLAEKKNNQVLLKDVLALWTPNLPAGAEKTLIFKWLEIKYPI